MKFTVFLLSLFFSIAAQAEWSYVGENHRKGRELPAISSVILISMSMAFAQDNYWYGEWKETETSAYNPEIRQLYEKYAFLFAEEDIDLVTLSRITVTKYKFNYHGPSICGLWLWLV